MSLSLLLSIVGGSAVIAEASTGVSVAAARRGTGAGRASTTGGGELPTRADMAGGGMGDGVRLRLRSADRKGILTGVGSGFDWLRLIEDVDVDSCCKVNVGADTDAESNSELR